MQVSLAGIFISKRVGATLVCDSPDDRRTICGSPKNYQWMVLEITILWKCVCEEPFQSITNVHIMKVLGKTLKVIKKLYIMFTYSLFLHKLLHTHTFHFQTWFSRELVQWNYSKNPIWTLFKECIFTEMSCAIKENLCELQIRSMVVCVCVRVCAGLCVFKNLSVLLIITPSVIPLLIIWVVLSCGEQQGLEVSGFTLQFSHLHA